MRAVDERRRDHDEALGLDAVGLGRFARCGCFRSFQVGWFFHQILCDEEITLFGDGKQLRDLTYVDCVVDALLLAGSHPAALWGFLNAYFRYSTRVNGFAQLLTDSYPPFHGRNDAEYPIRIAVQRPDRMSRLNVFFRGLLLIPHAIFAFFYSLGFLLALIATFFCILFVARIPETFLQMLTHYFVYNSRLNAYSLLLVDEYPPFHGEQPLAAETAFRPA